MTYNYLARCKSSGGPCADVGDVAPPLLRGRVQNVVVASDSPEPSGFLIPEFETRDARELCRDGGEEHGAVTFGGDLDGFIPLFK